MTTGDFRRIALSLPGAIESAYMGNPDFRVAGGIFATLSLEGDGYGVLKLTPEQQQGLVQDAPEFFSPVHGGWGRMGMTRVRLDAVTADVLDGSLRLAWQDRITKSQAKGARKKR
jgi:hypothetical protein